MKVLQRPLLRVIFVLFSDLRSRPAVWFFHDPGTRSQISCCSFIMSLNFIPSASAALRHIIMRPMNISK